MKKLIRPAMLIVPLTAGWFVPQAAILAAEPVNFIRWALCLMLFLNILPVSFADLKPCREHFIVLLLNIAMGVIPYLLLKFLIPGNEDFAQGAFFTGIAPTAVSAAVIVSLLNGKVGFAITGFIISSLGICLALLGLLPWVTGNLNINFFFSVLNTLLTVIALPLICARITGKIFPKIVEYTAVLKKITLYLWSFTLFIVAAVARKNFEANSDSSAISIWILLAVSLVICALNFLLGYLCARKDYRRDASQILGQKNTTFAIFLVLEYSSGSAPLCTIFYVLFHNLWNSAQLAWQRESK